MNNVPSFVILNSEAEYKKYFKNKYCKKSITTFDGIKVKFYDNQFRHSFYESSDHFLSNKDIFSIERAKRIDWIEYVLKNPEAELHVGWDKKTKTYSNNRRVAFITPDNYVVVIHINGNGTANYITSYFADSERTVKKIKNSPMWKNT